MGEFEKLGFDVEVKDADSAVKHLEAIAAALERIQAATKGGIKGKSITDALGGGDSGGSKKNLSEIEKYNRKVARQTELLSEANAIEYKRLRTTELLNSAKRNTISNNLILENSDLRAAKVAEQLSRAKAMAAINSDLLKKSEYKSAIATQEATKYQEQQIRLLARLNAEKAALNSKGDEEVRRIQLQNEQTKKEIDQRLKQELGIKEQTKSLTSYIGKLSLVTMLARRFAHFMTGAIQESANYVENLNLFAVAYGETYQETIDWALNIADAYGLANNEVVKFAGTFRQLSTSLGLVGDTATSVSKTVTELGYDLSALFNTSVESAMEKLQSSIFSGNVRPLRAYGIDISQNQIDALFETNEALASMGVNARNLSQSDKVLARMIIALRDGSNAFGTMKREINNLQSQIRIFQGSLSNFKMAIGDLFAEPLRNALVWVNAFIIAITNIIRAIKPLQKTDENNVINGVAESAEAAVEEIEQLNGKLAGFDKFNTLQTGSSGGSSSVTAALTEELAKQQAKYAETQEAMSGIKNEAVELSKTLTGLMPILVGLAAVGFYKWTQNAMIAASAAAATGDSISKLTALGAKLGKVFTPKNLGIFALAAGLIYLYNTNDYFKESITKLLDAISSLVSNALEPMFDVINLAMPVVVKLAQAFGYVLGFIVRLASWIINFIDRIGVLKGAVAGLIIAFIALKAIQVGKFFINVFTSAAQLIQIFPVLIPWVKAYGKAISGDIIKKMKTFIGWLKESKAAAAGLAVLGIGMLVTIVQQLIGNWGDLSGFQKVAGIFGAIGAAALAAAAAIAAFQGAWTLGTAAVAIVGALAAIAGAFATFKKDTQVSTSAHANGGYSNANLIMTHENGKREWVGKAAGSSAIVNDTQMSDIMRSAVGQGVFDALKANRAMGGNGVTGNETIVVKIGEEAVFNAVRKTAKRRGEGFAGV